MADGGAHSQVITCMMIEFSPVQGPRVKQRYEPLPGALDQQKKEWLVQFITKDLLHLQQEHRDYIDAVAGSRGSMQVRSSGASAQMLSTRGVNDSGQIMSANYDDGGPPLSNSNMNTNDDLEESQFVKVVCLDQLNVVVVVMFFSVFSEEPGGGSATSSSAAKALASMYAVAIVLFNVSTLRLRAALPTIRDRLFHAHQEILYADKDEIDIEKDWLDKLRDIAPMIDRWLTSRVEREKLSLFHTVLVPHSKVQLQTLCSYLTCAMSYHRCVIRADNPNLVSKWLTTIALFLPDDRLLFASVACKDSIVPDLTLQGTTMPLEDIIQRVPSFRLPPVILDVSRSLHEPCHYFPTVTITVFSEVRQKIFTGDSVVADISNSRTRPTTVKASTLVSTVCHRVFQILNPKHGRAQPVESFVVITPAGATAVPSSLGPRSAAAGGEISVKGPDDEVLSGMTVKSALISIEMWRRQLALRAFAFYVVEMELKRDRAVNITGQAGLRTQEVDHLVLQTAVDYVAQVQQVRERIVRTVLMETFIF
jgi:hypothetical protein